MQKLQQHSSNQKSWAFYREVKKYIFFFLLVRGNYIYLENVFSGTAKPEMISFFLWTFNFALDKKLRDA